MRTLSKIVVTGASGFVGKAVQEELRKTFHSVVAYMREESDPTHSYRLGSRIVRGDIDDATALREAFSGGVDAVVHLVGILREEGRNTFERVHVTGVRTVLDLAREYKVKKIVHVSALGARSDAVTRYHRTKWEAEKLVQSSELPATIVRPSVVFGSEAEFVRLIEFLVSFPCFTPVIDPGPGRLQPVWVRDLARIIRLCLEEESTDSAVYDIGGPETFSIGTLIEAFEARQGRQKPHVVVPAAFVGLAACALELPGIRQLVDFINKNICFLPRITRDQLSLLREVHPCDFGKIKDVFPFPFLRVSDWLASNEYRSHPWKSWQGRWIGSAS